MKEYSLGLYEKAMPIDLSWEQKFQAAKQAGYDFIEISIDETDTKLARLEMTKEERLELIKLMSKYAIPLRTMCLSGHRKYPLGSSDALIVERSLEIAQKAIDLADDLGIRIIQLAGYDVYYEQSSQETKERFLVNLKKVTTMAAKKGIVLGFETMETEFMNTVQKALKYVKEVNSPYLHIYPDCGNITNAATTYNTNVFDDLKTGEGHLVAMHLKETVPGKFREIPYGTGHVDFDTMIDIAWDLGVRRFVTEFWYVGSDDYQADLNSARKLMGDKLDKK